MIVKPIPKNALQRGLATAGKAQYGPDRDSHQITSGMLVEVWDAQAMAEGQVPDPVKKLLAARPGQVYGLVKLNQMKQIVLPFQATAEHLYSVYGNSRALVGWQVEIHYRNNSLFTGKLVPVNGTDQQLVDPEAVSTVADCGGILGV